MMFKSPAVITFHPQGARWLQRMSGPDIVRLDFGALAYFNGGQKGILSKNGLFGGLFNKARGQKYARCLMLSLVDKLRFLQLWWVFKRGTCQNTCHRIPRKNWRQTCHPNGASNHSPIAHNTMDEDLAESCTWPGEDRCLSPRTVIFRYQPTLLTQPRCPPLWYVVFWPLKSRAGAAVGDNRGCGIHLCNLRPTDFDLNLGWQSQAPEIFNGFSGSENIWTSKLPIPNHQWNVS